VAPDIVAQVHAAAKDKQKVIVFLDSNHTHEHVLAELEAYAPLVSKDSYCVVFDTFVEDVPADVFDSRPWQPGNSPKTAVHQYLQTHPEFEIDKAMQHKLQITVAPDGFLKRIA
jgi:cephalosporin hydroxylase